MVLKTHEIHEDGMSTVGASPSFVTSMRPSTELRSSREGGAGNANFPGMPYSNEETMLPEYSTDEFKMFHYKVAMCAKRYAHDWRACPFAHPTENARRRDPRHTRYCATACPDYKQGFCARGDLCFYAHGVFESWLHPSRFRTQLCKDGAQCNRAVCFFAHSLPELRAPTFTWQPGPEDLQAGSTLHPLLLEAASAAAPFDLGPPPKATHLTSPPPHTAAAAAAAAAAGRRNSSRRG
ncbi:hypothetical protein V8C86DRAFT_1080833 [Haematococcus lacustris]